MKILLTGHLGFIGHNIIQQRLYEKKGWRIIGYDIKDGDDILDKRKLEYLFETENIDCVIHCAALTGARRGELYSQEYFDTNVIGTKNVIDLAEKYNVGQFIHFSSSSVKQPDTIYGMSKLCGEQIALRADIKSMSIIRPFTVIGENGRQDQVIYKWLNAIKAGRPIKVHGYDTNRNFTYVGDIVKFVELILEKQLKEFSPFRYELCNPISIPLRELLIIFRKHFKDIEIDDVGLSEHEPFESKGVWSSKFPATDARKIIEKIIRKEK